MQPLPAFKLDKLADRRVPPLYRARMPVGPPRAPVSPTAGRIAIVEGRGDAPPRSMGAGIVRVALADDGHNDFHHSHQQMRPPDYPGKTK